MYKKFYTNYKCSSLVVSALIIFITWFAFVLNFSSSLKKDTSVIIAKGQSVAGIANYLKQQNIINSPWLFRGLARLNGVDKSIHAGEYFFSANVSINEVLNKLASGEVIQHSITFPEGLTSAEIVAILRGETKLSGEIKAVPAEGTLLPETYKFTLNSNRNHLISIATNAMEEALNEAWNNRNKSLPLKTKHDLLTLASIVEKETSIDYERPIVASVFINRLKKGMRLQADPTVIYGMENYNGDITRKHLKTKTPYNTYMMKGLPRGPIANPGVASLFAVANPAKTSYLYFVADSKGAHTFAKTNAEHNKNVKAYLAKLNKN